MLERASNLSFVFFKFVRSVPREQSAKEWDFELVSGAEFWCSLCYFSSRGLSLGSRGPPWAPEGRKSAKNPGPDVSLILPKVCPARCHQTLLIYRVWGHGCHQTLLIYWDLGPWMSPNPINLWGLGDMGSGTAAVDYNRQKHGIDVSSAVWHTLHLQSPGVPRYWVPRGPTCLILINIF